MNTRRRGKHSSERLLLYFIWRNMKMRCYWAPYRDFHCYGGRGISVCQRWRNSFSAFLQDMGERPSQEHTLDRYPDNNGNYEPSNCRWATTKEQGNNRRSNVVLEYAGKRLTVTEWSAITGLKRATIYSRIMNYGFTVAEALTKVADKNKRIAGRRRLKRVLSK